MTDSVAHDRRNLVRSGSSRCALFLALVSALSSPALARTLKVPEDFPTIQSAVDHLEQFFDADTVLVKAGHYPEQVKTREALCLRGVMAPGNDEPMPRIDGLLVQPPSEGQIIQVIGFHVSGPARTAGSDGPDQVYYESCRFDAGMEGGNWYPDIEVISMRRCTLFGTVSLKALETVVDSCTVHGPIVMLAVGAAVVTNSVFESIPGFAADVFSEQRVNIARNVVRGGGGGFRIRGLWEDFGRVEDNRVEGCTGTGITVDTPDFFSCYIQRNQVERCGGTGITASGLIQATDNRVLDCGGHGMDLVQLDRTGRVERNVVGRCGADGIRLQRYPWGDALGFRAMGNTIYSCTGSGIVSLGLTGGSISNNIAFRNSGHGLLSTGSDAVPVSCNDWFENRAGATSGTAAAASDLAVDPLFCDVAADDVALRSDSPLLGAPGCGQIGALGQGCEPPPVVIELDLKLDVLPAASRGRWAVAWLEPGAPYTASDIEIASVRLNGVPATGDGFFGDRDRDGVSDLQLRFDRVAFAQTLGRGAVATVTVTGRMRGRQFVGTDGVRIPHGQWFRRPTDLDPEASAPVLSIRAPGIGSVSGGLRLTFTLADARPARLELLDVAGRVVFSQEVAGAGPGDQTMELGERGRLAQGIYFLRLRQGTSEARTRAAIVR